MRYGGIKLVSDKPDLQAEEGVKMLEIQKAQAQDAEELLQFCNIVGQETDNLSFGKEGLSISVEQEKAYLESLSEENKQIFLTAREAGEIVGTATLMGFARPRMAHRGEISICVRKSMWGKEIGTRLMEELISRAKQFSMEIISLEVKSDNKRAIALYKKFGFETIGTFPGFMKIDGELAAYDMMCLHLPKKGAGVKTEECRCRQT